jgi:rhodanese-related sulfurtransferase
MKTIAVHELKALMDENVNFQLVDVRESYEYEFSNLNGLHIPMQEIPTRYAEISRDIPVVVHCRSGIRSAQVIQFLNQAYGFDNLANLEGGIKAWAAEIDPSMETN